MLVQVEQKLIALRGEQVEQSAPVFEGDVVLVEAAVGETKHERKRRAEEWLSG